MNVHEYHAQIDNYHGQCVHAIAKSGLSDADKCHLIRQLPNTISYSQYIGFAGIIEGTQSHDQLYKMFNQHFYGESIFDFIFDLPSNILRMFERILF